MIAALKIIAPLLLYIAALVILFMSLSGRVKYGLWFLIPLIPLQNVMDKFQAFPMGKDLNDILLIAMLLGWLFSSLSLNQPVLSKTSLNGVLFFFALYIYFSLWLGTFTLHLPAPIDIHDLSVQRWKNYMIFPLLYFLTSNNIRDLPDMKKLFAAMCAAMFLMNYYNVQQVSDLTAWYSRSKLTGTFVDLGANETAAFYATYPFVLIGIFFFVKKWQWRIPLAVLILTDFFVNLFCYSRGAYIAALAGAFVFGLIKQRVLLVPIILVLALWQSVLPQSVIDRILFTEVEGELDYSASRRVELWEQSLMYFQQNPVFGVGFNVFKELGEGGDTHNMFLRTLAEQGVAGILILMVIFGICLGKGWQLYRKAEDDFLKGLGLGFFVCVIAMIVCNFFGDRWSHLPLGAFFWVFLGMVERGIILSANSAPEAAAVTAKKDAVPRRNYVDSRLVNPYTMNRRQGRERKGN